MSLPDAVGEECRAGAGALQVVVDHRQELALRARAEGRRRDDPRAERSVDPQLEASPQRR